MAQSSIIDSSDDETVNSYGTYDWFDSAVSQDWATSFSLPGEINTATEPAILTPALEPESSTPTPQSSADSASPTSSVNPASLKATTEPTSTSTVWINTAVTTITSTTTELEYCDELSSYTESAVTKVGPAVFVNATSSTSIVSTPTGCGLTTVTITAAPVVSTAYQTVYATVTNLITTEVTVAGSVGSSVSLEYGSSQLLTASQASCAESGSHSTQSSTHKHNGALNLTPGLHALQLAALMFI